ncbi:hypothetical protein [Kaarinaea lacus]
MKLNTFGNAVLIILGLGLFSLAQVSFAQTQQNSSEDQEWEKLLEDNAEEKALQVNEGELEFLKSPPTDKPVHTVTNTITISDDSLETHWVALHQCHKNLDPVAASEIVYQYEQMRNLRVEHYYGIDKAWVENQTVQMKDIERGATLCVVADVRILKPNNQGGYVLRNGPYFRKFLDGYYPFHVMVKINYPKSSLTLNTTHPKPQSGFDVEEDNGRLTMDAWFEGKLMVEAQFKQVATP